MPSLDIHAKLPPTAGDLREGHAWSKRQRTKNDLLWFVASLALALVRALPRAWLPSLGRSVGRLLHRLLGRERRRARENVALCFPRLDRAERAELVARTFVSLGETLADTIALLDPSEPAERTLVLPPASFEVLERALAMGRGVVYITAHLGPWERMAAVLAARGFPITTVARESYDPRFDQLYDRLRRPRGVVALYRGSSSTPLAIVRALRGNRVVGFPIDLPGRVPTVPVELLGQPSKLPIGPARIALRTSSPIVVGTPQRRADGGLEIGVRTLSTDGLQPGASGEAALTQRMADALGERIGALPEHWPWMHPSFDEAHGRRRCDAPRRPDRLSTPT